jgi:phosphoribosylpyrophosphate synthetase
MCSHSLISENIIRRLFDARVENIISTNFIPNRFEKIEISPVVASCIREGIS